MLYAGKYAEPFRRGNGVLDPFQLDDCLGEMTPRDGSVPLEPGRLAEGDAGQGGAPCVLSGALAPQHRGQKCRGPRPVVQGHCEKGAAVSCLGFAERIATDPCEPLGLDVPMVRLRQRVHSHRKVRASQREGGPGAGRPAGPSASAWAP